MSTLKFKNDILTDQVREKYIFIRSEYPIHSGFWLRRESLIINQRLPLKTFLKTNIGSVFNEQQQALKLNSV